MKTLCMGNKQTIFQIPIHNINKSCMLISHIVQREKCIKQKNGFEARKKDLQTCKESQEHKEDKTY